MPRADTHDVRREDGFTLPEMLAVLTIVGTLSAIAVGSYSGARVGANDAAARSNIDVAVPAFQAYFLDNGAYTGMTLRRLQTTYSRGIRNISIVSARATTYCVRSTVGGRSWYKAGPSDSITTTRCR
jgi:prepilin-type N-terminal cleavage/methylation domain-containing protein